MINSKKSLAEVHASISVPKTNNFWKLLMTFIGPGSLVAVGYMDPGNWITSVIGGAKHGYSLLIVILISSLIAMQLQQMAGKLGMVTQKDLAQLTAEHLPKPVRYLLFVIAELALMATDLAEVIGSAIALHLLFGWSLIFSVFVTIFDVFILLLLMKFGFRKIEALVSTLILTIFLIFLFLTFLAKPHPSAIFAGYLPQTILSSPPSQYASLLTLSLGIIGATVMPHNLYLHSAISQTRAVDTRDKKALKKAIHFMTLDSNLQLSLAFLVNSLLLILGASIFQGKAEHIKAFSDMYQALADPKIAGSIASASLSTLFATALLASGQNSTITGTLTGEIVMEGFLNITLPRWLIRMITRSVALLPVAISALIFGNTEGALDQLLIYSQVFLSIALPFSIFPLIYFSSKKDLMGEFQNRKWNTVLAYAAAVMLTLLNLKLIIDLW